MTRSLGGIELNVVRLAAWLNARGHECLIISACGAPLLEYAISLGIETYSTKKPRRYGAFRETRTLAAELRHRSVETIIVNASRDFNFGVLVKRASRNQLHLIQWQHMQFGSPKRNLFHRWQYGHLSAWIAPSSWLAGQTEVNTSIPPDRIHVIPFGIELQRFENKPSREHARRRLGLPLDETIVGNIGRFDKGKGQEYLLRAVALLGNGQSDTHLLLVGEDTRGETQRYGAFLKQLANDLGLGNRVHFRPFMHEVEIAYAAMDMFVLSSLSESFGMVTVEAMASGLPIVATNSAGTPDILTHEDTALLVSPMDAALLASSMRQLLDNPTQANAYASAARQDATKRFSHERQCRLTEKLLDSLSAFSHAT